VASTKDLVYGDNGEVASTQYIPTSVTIRFRARNCDGCEVEHGHALRVLEDQLMRATEISTGKGREGKICHSLDLSERETYQCKLFVTIKRWARYKGLKASESLATKFLECQW
jgi:hypothetical protein